ncbi:MAG: DUF2278 family protein [Methylococcaceae bacterium]
MSIYYGVLEGKVDVFKREDNDDTPHLQIRVIDGNNQAWRIPVNVLSADQSFLIFHRADPLQSHPVLGGLSSLSPGFTLLPVNDRSVSNALDFFRSPLFDWPTGIEAPPTGPGENDDLQDTLVTYLNNLKSQNGDLFVFGAKFPEPGQSPNPRTIDREFGTVQGLHDVHMNQGNPPGPHQEDNGVFQDGGLILRFPNRYVGLFLRFQSQWLPTNDTNGNRLPSAAPIPPGGLPGTVPGTVSNPEIYIERALVNPTGNDIGREAVVIGNTTSSAVNLINWSLVDRNGNVESISGILQAGESRIIVLSGDSVQLGNRGGTIRLKDASGNQVHAVTYSREDAQKEGRYLRFNT